MSTEQSSKMTPVEIPPVCLKSDIAKKLVEKGNQFWMNITGHDFTILGAKTTANPSDPLLKIRSNSHSGIEREILLHHIQSANGVPLPPVDQLVSAFA